MTELTYRSKRLGEQYSVTRHKSGMTLLFYPMPSFRSAYVSVTARIGSVDCAYRTDGAAGFTRLPDGVAHFLEHKLFENEDGDAFAKYARTGASANAYTSFSQTSYLFSTTDHFREALDILLGFVTQPYFTADSVAKEQGIIGQEIGMYDDDPDWQSYNGVLGALYQRFPLNRDIAGSRASIAEITAPLLYDCYHAFYNPPNLTLTAAGRFDPAVILDACDRLVPETPPVAVQGPAYDEPAGVAERRVERRMAISLPVFTIGFKERALPPEQLTLRALYTEILLDMLVSDVSSFYRKLYDAQLINDSFSHEVMTCRGQWLSLFSGESRDPDAVFAALCETFDAARRQGLDRKAFARSRRAIYGRLMKSFDNVEAAASTILEYHFANVCVYDIIEKIATVSFEEIAALLDEVLRGENAALSVVLPNE